MRILLFGKDGQLGRELQNSISSIAELVALNKNDSDLTDHDQIVHHIQQNKPSLILNAAAFTAVDQAETEPYAARLVNGIAPGIIANEAKKIGAHFIHFSTDYVFDGRKTGAYTEQDSPNPINMYGKSKLVGEQSIQDVGGSYLIFRTSWLYDRSSESFVGKVLHWARNQPIMKIVYDQSGSPTWSRTLAELTAKVLTIGGEDFNHYLRQRRGIYHLAGKGQVSRYDWALAIMANDPKSEEQVVESVIPVRSKEFKTAARRPPNSALNCALFERVFGLEIPEWSTTLKMAMSATV